MHSVAGPVSLNPPRGGAHGVSVHSPDSIAHTDAFCRLNHKTTDLSCVYFVDSLLRLRALDVVHRVLDVKQVRLQLQLADVQMVLCSKHC